MVNNKFNFNFKRIKEAINFLSEEQLRLLERQIAAKLKSKIMSDFKVMDKVFFDYNGQKISGTIISLNQKTVTIIEENGRKWNVSPHFLNKNLEMGDLEK